jgi:hypothetical protein
MAASPLGRGNPAACRLRDPIQGAQPRTAICLWMVGAVVLEDSDPVNNEKDMAYQVADFMHILQK